MKRQTMIAGAVTLVAGTLGLGYHIGKARANGIPLTSTMSYTGTLYTYGQIDSGTHSIGVALWVSGATTAACTTQPITVTLINGQFTVPLSDSCVTAVHQNANLQVQITVDNNQLPLTPLGAVPYAVEADTASNGAPGSALGNAAVPGQIIAYGGTVDANNPPPAGWLLCDGSSVSRSKYPNLFAAIGLNYGFADGISFNLPDLRGRFLRGTDNGAGHDPDAAARTPSLPGGNQGDAVGSYQADQFGSHSHSLPYEEGQGSAGTGFSGYMYSSNSGFPQSTTGSSTAGGSETRGKNVNVNFLIRY
jgi:microcystin-dependent protein